MIGYIKGTIEEILEDGCIIDHQGMGYVVKLPTNFIGQLSIGKQVKIYTYLYVREDQVALFGFESKNQLEMFEMLILVNGIGPKAAMGILSTLSVIVNDSSEILLPFSSSDIDICIDSLSM